MALDPPPYASPLLLDQSSGTIHPDWLRWDDALYRTVRAQPVEIGLTSAGNPPVHLTGKTAAILTTAIPLPAITGGFYRVSWYVRKTVADGVTSSVTVTIGWTESGVALTLSGAALATDATTAVQSFSTPLILVDQSTAITYATAYASNTPNKMTYRLSVLVEEL